MDSELASCFTVRNERAFVAQQKSGTLNDENYIYEVAQLGAIIMNTTAVINTNKNSLKSKA